MERDLDLFREIMFEIEKSGKVNDLNPIQIQGHSREEVSYHVLKPEEANLKPIPKMYDVVIVCH